MTWNPGKTLKNRTYTILSELGRGGFAITYLVQDTHGRQFVIKTLNDEIISHPDFKTFQDNFHKEATSLAQFNHPHIVKIDSLFYESEQDQVICCLVMDYIQGQNLHQLGILSEDLAESYIKQVAEALILIHSKNILHRDVKPENIMLSNITSQAILIDFGIAREFTPNQAKNLTQFWSDGYSPIEQYDDQYQSSYYTDVYGLAATFYTLLTDTIPPDARERETQINQNGKDVLIPPKEINNNISDRLNNAIIKGMALKPNKRPQSIQEWLDVIDGKSQNTWGAFTKFGINVTQHHSTKQSTNDSLAFLLIPIILLLGIGGAIYWKYFRPLPPDRLEYNLKKVYPIGESIVIKDGLTCDENGGDDLTNIKIILTDKNEATIKDLGNVTPFKKDDKCAKFNYELKDKELLKPGDYKLLIIAYDRTNQQLSESKPFKINGQPTLDNLNLKSVYDLRENMIINGLKVCDPNGKDDLEQIDFTIGDKTFNLPIKSINEKELITDKKEPNCLTLKNHIIQLNLKAGNYQIQAKVTDKSSTESGVIASDFKVNAPPRKLNLVLTEKPDYKVGDNLTITRTDICDRNGWDDINKVEFEWRIGDGNWQKFAEINKSQFNKSDDQCANYSNIISLNLTTPGDYQIRAIGYDVNDKSSNIYLSNKITVIPPSINITIPDKPAGNK